MITNRLESKILVGGVSCFSQGVLKVNSILQTKHSNFTFKFHRPVKFSVTLKMVTILQQPFCHWLQLRARTVDTFKVSIFLLEMRDRERVY